MIEQAAETIEAVRDRLAALYPKFIICLSVELWSYPNGDAHRGEPIKHRVFLYNHDTKTSFDGYGATWAEAEQAVEHNMTAATPDSDFIPQPLEASHA